MNRNDRDLRDEADALRRCQSSAALPEILFMLEDSRRDRTQGQSIFAHVVFTSTNAQYERRQGSLRLFEHVFIGLFGLTGSVRSFDVTKPGRRINLRLRPSPHVSTSSYSSSTQYRRVSQ